MIKNIILDIGDVLVKSNYHDFFLGKGYSEETALQLEQATFFTPVWKELDRGIWSFEEIIEGFVRNAPGLEPVFRSVFEDMNGFIKVYPYSRAWIQELKESGLKVFCLSNISDKICRDCAEDMQFMEDTDGNVLSYQEHLIKPDHEIFQLILKRYGLAAEECVFMDDMESNVKTARELGIHGIVFRNKEQAEVELKEIRRLNK